jgi:(S)-ureidoglycine aminohydrolase
MQQGLVGSRAVVARNFAILPPEGIPEIVLPEWPGAAVRVLTAPAMGARFAMYEIALPAGAAGTPALAPRIEGFLYVLAGRVRLELDGKTQELATGGFAYLAPGARGVLAAAAAARVVWLRKPYAPWGERAPASRVGSEREIKGEPFMDIAELNLKKLLPETLDFDMAMNVFTFPPGFSLPVIETHIMEHGLCFLEGQGLYYLGDAWREVKAGDFIWMGPYCPQGFFATGSTPARYLYYKNVHRDVEL